MNNLPHGYKPHNGKNNFRSEKPVRVLYRNMMESKQVAPANKWRAKSWGWESDFDIIGAREEGVHIQETKSTWTPTSGGY